MRVQSDRSLVNGHFLLLFKKYSDSAKSLYCISTSFEVHANYNLHQNHFKHVYILVAILINCEV